MPLSFPPRGMPGGLAFRSPSASFPPPSHPHPQPHPTSLVLSHHGDRISKWEGLESPHILPPPLLSRCAPLLWLLDSHMCRQDSRCGQGGHPLTPRVLTQFLCPPSAGTSVQVLGLGDH